MGSKYTIEEVRNIFLDQGCELLSQEYKTVHDKLEYKCSCGNSSRISVSRFLFGSRCKECGNKKKGANVKYSYKQVKRVFVENNCELLSKDYINARTPLEYKCSCGNVAEIRLTHFLRGHRCRECGIERVKNKLKYTYEQVENIFQEQGCELLSKGYKGFHVKLDYKCSCGGRSQISLSHFLSGKRCKKCGIRKNSGKNHSNYNPNLTAEDRISRRKIPENDIWRKNVYTKDDYTCQKCFKRGGRLNAHHIQNYSSNKELRFNKDNGICFCYNCHLEFHKTYGYNGNTQKQLDKFLNMAILA